jgi:hypothetical protein
MLAQAPAMPKLFLLFPVFFMFPIALFAIGVVVIIVLAIFGAQQEKKRKEALKQWAQSRGYRFRETRDPDMRHRFPNFKCLDLGDRDKYAYNIIDGASGDRRLLMFDYHYESRSTDKDGKTEYTSHYLTVLIVTPPYPLKPLVIRSEGLFDKIGGFFGYDDIDFESAEFSRRFHASAPDRRWAYDVLHNRAIEHLMTAPKHQIQFDHACGSTYKSGTATPHDYQQLLQTLDGLFVHMPEYVVKQQRELAAN